MISQILSLVRLVGKALLFVFIVTLHYETTHMSVDCARESCIFYIKVLIFAEFSVAYYALFRCIIRAEAWRQASLATEKTPVLV